MGAAGVREISFGNTFPVKVREARNGQVRTEAGGGWIGWALFNGRSPDDIAAPPSDIAARGSAPLSLHVPPDGAIRAERSQAGLGLEHRCQIVLLASCRVIPAFDGRHRELHIAARHRMLPGLGRQGAERRLIFQEPVTVGALGYLGRLAP